MEWGMKKGISLRSLGYKERRQISSWAGRKWIWCIFSITKHFCSSFGGTM